jgi:stage V sporulation protein SpoVS
MSKGIACGAATVRSRDKLEIQATKPLAGNQRDLALAYSPGRPGRRLRSGAIAPDLAPIEAAKAFD